MARIQQMTIKDFNNGDLFWKGSCSDSTFSFRDVEKGFISTRGGRVFLATRRGRCTFVFPVLEDGRVSKTSATVSLYPNETVHALNPAAIGIKFCNRPDGGKELEWTDDCAYE